MLDWQRERKVVILGIILLGGVVLGIGGALAQDLGYKQLGETAVGMASTSVILLAAVFFWMD